MPEDLEKALKYLETLRADTAAKRQAMYGLLQATPIVRIEVVYDGYADSGMIEEIRCFGADGSAIAGDEAICDAVEAYVAAALPGGWESNEGSFGTVEIDVAARKASFDHTFRVESTEHSPFED